MTKCNYCGKDAPVNNYILRWAKDEVDKFLAQLPKKHSDRVDKIMANITREIGDIAQQLNVEWAQDVADGKEKPVNVYNDRFQEMITGSSKLVEARDLLGVPADFRIPRYAESGSETKIASKVKLVERGSDRVVAEADGLRVPILLRNNKGVAHRMWEEELRNIEKMTIMEILEEYNIPYSKVSEVRK